MRRPLRIALLAATAALALAGPGVAAAQTPRLVGIVGPDFDIRLTDANGDAVTQLNPGTYDIAIDDRSEEHNFHLAGPGVDQRTQVEFVGQVTWTVTLVEGRFDLRLRSALGADARRPRRRQPAAAAAAPPPPPPPPPPAPPPLSDRAARDATVGPGFTIGRAHTRRAQCCRTCAPGR